MDADEGQGMSSSRPYLVRAMYEWILDNGMTPYLLVQAGVEGVQVPAQYIRDGRIVLNIAGRAVQALDLGNDLIAFSARFGGQPMEVFIPLQAVLAIYAQENGQGMMFPEDDGQTGPDTAAGPHGDGPDGDGPDDGGGSPPPRGGRPQLKVVK